MSTKTKNSKTTSTQINDLAMQAGLVLMTAAATLGMLELPEHPNKVIVPSQPSFAVATDATENAPNPLRREREETAPHFISYSTFQRTPGRTGKI